MIPCLIDMVGWRSLLGLRPSPKRDCGICSDWSLARRLTTKSMQWWSACGLPIAVLTITEGQAHDGCSQRELHPDRQQFRHAGQFWFATSREAFRT
jgi:hypothetical protein